MSPISYSNIYLDIIALPNIINNLDNPIICLDATKKIAAINKQAISIHGFNKNKLHGKNYLQLCKLAGIHNPLRKILPTTLHIIKKKLAYEGATGTITIVTWLIVPIFTDNNFIGYILIGTDIQHSKIQKKPQQHLQITTQLLAIINRELRTQLNNIIGLTELLSAPSTTDNIAETRIKQCTPPQTNYIQVIQQSSSSLIQLISCLIEHMDFRAGNLLISDEQYSLHLLLEQLVKKYMIPARNKGIHDIKIHYGYDLPKLITGDSRYVHQILDILLHNSTKFSNSGLIEIIVEQTLNNQLKLSIKDCGIGIDMHQQKNLFNIFAINDYTDVDDDHYTEAGLKLSIAKQLISAMGGNIGLISSPNKGSTFWITIPYKEKQPTKNLPANFDYEIKATETAKYNTKTRSNLGTITPNILLIEDNPLNLLVTKSLLENIGCTITVATTVDNAINVLKQHSYHLILTDIALPDSNGLQLAIIINSMFPDSKPPVIAITAYTAEQDIENFIKSGIDDVLLKPVNTHMLTQILQTYVPGFKQTSNLNLPTYAENHVRKHGKNCG